MTSRAVSPLAQIRVWLASMQIALTQVGWIGALVGFVALTLLMPGGDDGFNFYLRPYWSGATAPAWTFLVTTSVSPLMWPLRWTALAVISVLVAVWSRRAIGDRCWWILLFSHAFVVNIWMGQIEVFPIAGIGLAWLVLARKIHPSWFGIAILALITKVQVGAGLALLFTFWVWREQGLRSLIWGAGAALAIVGVTLILYPNWPVRYVEALGALAPQDQIWNASIYPLGLLTVPMAFYSRDIGKMRRARMVASVTLLASPYFAWYHPSAALLLETRGAMMWLSWIDALPRILFGYKQNGWIVLVIMLGWDVWQIWRERQSLESAAKS